MNYVKLAEEIAKESHKGQKRTIGRKEDYINHPLRVASHFSTEKSKIIALLHDVLEDTHTTEEDLIDEGIPQDCVEVIKILTRAEGEDYFNYILRVLKNEDAIKIKIADLNDNLEKLNYGSLRDKYLLAKYILENLSEFLRVKEINKIELGKNFELVSNGKFLELGNISLIEDVKLLSGEIYYLLNLKFLGREDENIIKFSKEEVKEKKLPFISLDEQK